MADNDKRSWVFATLVEEVQDYVAHRADELEREHGIDLDPDDRAKALARAATPALAESAKEHARMVREFVALIRAEYPDMDEMIDAGEDLAQAIEKGGEQ